MTAGRNRAQDGRARVKGSSYRAYGGWDAEPKWLQTGPLLAVLGGGRPAAECRARCREAVEALVREGQEASPWERVAGGLLLGSREFVVRMQQRLRGNAREQPSLRQLRRVVSFGEVVKVVEGVKGEPWAAFRDRHGDWGRDLALWLARRCCGLTLRELGQAVGGVDYVTVFGAVRRLERRAARDRELAAARARCLTQLKNEKT